MKWVRIQQVRASARSLPASHRCQCLHIFLGDGDEGLFQRECFSQDPEGHEALPDQELRSDFAEVTLLRQT